MLSAHSFWIRGEGDWCGWCNATPRLMAMPPPQLCVHFTYPHLPPLGGSVLGKGDLKRVMSLPPSPPSPEQVPPLR